MKRTIGIVAMLIALGTILVGCSSGPTKEQQQQAQAAKAEKANK